MEFMQIEGKQFLVVGLGRSGLSAARFLKKRGGDVTITDSCPEKDLGPTARSAREEGFRLELGSHREASFMKADSIIISPGVPHTISPIAKAVAGGVPLLGELELAGRFIEEPIIAVTGTNGKTTTTSLLASMLEHSGLRVFVGGNIGNPLIDYAEQPGSTDVLVVEVSSFQLDTISQFHPSVALLLNITDDHLDRYPDFNAYAASKLRIFENQNKSDFAVINSADPGLLELTHHLSSRRLLFGYQKNGLQSTGDGAWINGQYLQFRTGSKLSRRIDIADLKIRGRHNLENAAAAALGALAGGGTMDGVEAALKSFRGLPHRMEPIGHVNHVEFVNDSKATNVDAALRALESFDNPVVLIMGGLDKGGDFQRLLSLVRSRVTHLILMGASAPVIEKALAPAASTRVVADMQEAVAEGFRSAGKGDVVLLSPGCASFDMYENYAQRGDDFRGAFNRLKDDIENRHR
jgi:UDP-N-acetylmuramoylalanine--D-glutamate ligase